MSRSLSTRRELLIIAYAVPLVPPPSHTVFYHGEEGKSRSADFIARNGLPYARLDELLKRSLDGRYLYRELIDTRRRWVEIEEVWWELSRRLARAASGDVWCFGPERDLQSGNADQFRSRFVQTAYANTVFDKVQLPELELNPRVTRIYYNERVLN